MSPEQSALWVAGLAFAAAVIGHVVAFLKGRGRGAPETIVAKAAIDARIDARLSERMTELEDENVALRAETTKLTNEAARFKRIVFQWWARLIAWDVRGRNGNMPMPSEDELEFMGLAFSDDEGGDTVPALATHVPRPGD